MKTDVHIRWSEGQCIASVVILDCFFQTPGATEEEARQKLEQIVEASIEKYEQEVKKNQERAIALAQWLSK